MKALKTDTLTQRIGSQLRDMRKDSGMTQEQLGQKAGMTKASISRLENGVWSPSLKCLEPVLKALGCKLVIQAE